MARNLLALVLCGMIMILSGCQSTNHQSRGQEVSTASESRYDSMSEEASLADASSQDNSIPSQNPLFLSQEYLPEYDMQNDIQRFEWFCETPLLDYFIPGDGFLWYYDKSVGKLGKLCPRPECTHDDNTCNAFLPGSFKGGGLCYYDGLLYYLSDIQTKDIMKKQQLYCGLYSLSLDGTQRNYVQDVNFSTNGFNGFFRLHRGYIYHGVINTIVAGGESQTRIIIRRQILGDSSAEAEILFEKKVEPNRGCDFFFQISGTTMYLLIEEHLITEDILQYEDLEACTIDLRDNVCKPVGSYHLEDGCLTTDMHEYDGVIYIARYNPFESLADLTAESINMVTGDWNRICTVPNKYGVYPLIGKGIVTGIGVRSETSDAERMIVIADHNGNILSELPVAMTEPQRSNREIMTNSIVKYTTNEVLILLYGEVSGVPTKETIRLSEALLSCISIFNQNGNWDSRIITP